MELKTVYYFCIKVLSYLIEMVPNTSLYFAQLFPEFEK